MDRNSSSRAVWERYVLELKWRVFYLMLACLSTILLVFLRGIEAVDMFLLSYPFCIDPTSGGKEESRWLLTGLSEGVNSLVQVAVIVALFVMVPLFVYHCSAFLRAALVAKQAARIEQTLIGSLILSVITLLLLELVIMPHFANVLLGFQTTRHASDIDLELRLSEYLSWQVSCFLAALLVVAMVCIIWELSLRNSFYWKATRADASFAGSKRSRPLARVVLLAALISPPDLVQQLAISFLLMIAQELLVFLALLLKRLDMVRY